MYSWISPRPYPAILKLVDLFIASVAMRQWRPRLKKPNSVMQHSTGSLRPAVLTVWGGRHTRYNICNSLILTECSNAINPVIGTAAIGEVTTCLSVHTTFVNTTHDDGPAGSVFGAIGRHTCSTRV